MLPTFRLFALGLTLLAASCAGLSRNDRGVLQPQTVSGPCEVKKFFFLHYSTTPTELTVANTGEACRFTLINPDLQFFNTAALVSTPARHGQAASGLLLGGTSAFATYTPQPGYTGPDSFTVTLEPNDRAVTLNVTVRGG